MYKIAGLFCAALILNLNAFSQKDTSHQYESFLEHSLEDFLKMEISSVSKSKDQVANAPATVYVFSREKIKNRGYVSLSQLLESVPGIEIQRKSNAEAYQVYTINGITGIEKFIIMLDGVRISSRLGTPHQVDYNFSVANAERVEVIIGPASALYGVDAFTGVINIVSRKAEGKPTLDANLNYGRFGTGIGSLFFGMGNETNNYSLNASMYTSKEPFMPDFYPSEYKWYTNDYSVNGTVGSPFDSTVSIPIELKPYATPQSAFSIVNRLKLKSFEIGNSINYQSTNTSISVDPKFSVYRKDAIRSHLISTSYLRYTIERSKLILKSTLSHQYLEVMPKSKFVNFYSSYKDAYKYARDQNIKFEEQLNYKINDRSNIVGGFTIEHFDAIPNTSDLPYAYNKDIKPEDQKVPYLGTSVLDSNGNDLTIYQDFFHIKYQNFGSYLQFKKSIKDKLHLTLGSRYDYNSRYGSSVNPRMGLVFTPNQKITTKLMMGTAFLSPSTFKSFKHYGAFMVNSDTTGFTSSFWHLTDPDLKPEKLRTGEIGISYLVNKNLQFVGNVFVTYISNLIVGNLFYNELFKGVPIAVVERNINKGSATTRGGSIGLNTKLKVGNISLNPSLFYTYITGNTAGQPLLYAAPHTLKSSLDFNIHKFSGAVEMLYRTPSKTVLEGVSHSNPAFLLINLYLNYKLFENEKYSINVNLDIDNLLDTRYYNVPNESTLITLPLTPQDPIRVNFGLNFVY